MNWENLSVSEFQDSLAKTGGVCLLPIGCLEKHGGHLPLGTDIAQAREIARRAAAVEEFLIFPYYPFGFVSEVRHKLGTVALEAKLQFQILTALCDEIARNGYPKIVFGNYHGGNNSSLRAFAQSQLDRRRDYLVYVYDLWRLSKKQSDWLAAKYGAPAESGHADIYETSNILTMDERLVHLERVNAAESRAQHRLDALARLGVYTAVNWYADYPHQFAGDPTGASAEYGNDLLSFSTENLVEVIREIKRDQTAAKLLNEFYDASDRPSL